MIPSLLETKRLKLRPFIQSDATAVLEYSTSDPDWPRFQRRVSSDYSSIDAEKFVAELIDRDREIQPNWAVTIDDRVIGIVSVTFEFEHRIAVLGYGIHGEYRGNGLSGEASEVVIDHSFKSYIQLRRIRAHTDARNAASIRVLEKLGFSCEGILRSDVFVKDEFVDDAVYGLLRDEWSG
jgi:ribosomal-protein-alanine N-acetyltransferase